MSTPKIARKIQIGKESTPGTAVAATTVYRGGGALKDTRVIKTVPENIGLLVPSQRTYTPKVEASIDFDSVEATFEQLPYLFAAGIKNVVTGVADGAGSGKIYDYPFPVSTTKNTIQTYSIEAGNLQQEEEFAYAFVSEFDLKGEAGGAVMMGGKWLGRQVAPDTYTGSLAVPTIETILFQKGKLYIDAAGGTLGATLRSNTFVSFGLKCKTGQVPVYTGDGNLYFSSVDFAEPSIELDITFIHDAISVAQRAAWRAETAQLIRLLFIGSALTTPGTAYTYKTFKADLAGKWTSFESLAEKDGIEVSAGKFLCGLDTTASLYADFTIVNELSTLT